MQGVGAAPSNNSTLSAKKPKGGLFGLGFGPDLNLGVSEAAHLIPSAIGGLVNLAAAPVRAFQENSLTPLAETFGGVAKGLANQAIGIAETPVAPVAGWLNQHAFNHLGLAPQTLGAQIREQGLLAPVINTAALVSGGASLAEGGIARFGSAASKIAATEEAVNAARAAGLTEEGIQGARTAGEAGEFAGRAGKLKDVARAARRSAGLEAAPEDVAAAQRTLGRLGKLESPYKSAFQGVRNIGRAANEAADLAPGLPPVAEPGVPAPTVEQPALPGFEAKPTPGRLNGPMQLPEEMIPPNPAAVQPPEIVPEAPRLGPKQLAAQYRASQELSPRAQQLAQSLPAPVTKFAQRVENFAQGRTFKAIADEQRRFSDAARTAAAMNRSQGLMSDIQANLADTARWGGDALDPEKARQAAGEQVQAAIQGTREGALRPAYDKAAEGALPGMPGAVPPGITAAHESFGVHNILTPEQFHSISDMVNEAATHEKALTAQDTARAFGSRLGEQGLSEVGRDDLATASADKSIMSRLTKSLNDSYNKLDRRRQRDILANGRQVLGSSEAIAKASGAVEDLHLRASALENEVINAAGLDPSRVTGMTPRQVSASVLRGETQSVKVSDAAANSAMRQAGKLEGAAQRAEATAGTHLAKIKSFTGFEDMRLALDLPEGVDPSTMSARQIANLVKQGVNESDVAFRGRARGIGEATASYYRAITDSDRLRTKANDVLDTAVAKPALESDRELLNRARAIQTKADAATRLRHQAEVQARAVDRMSEAHEAMVDSINSNALPADAAFQKQINDAAAMAGRVAERTNRLAGGAQRVSPALKPFVQGVAEMQELAIKDPSLLPYVADMPKNMAEVFQYLKDRNIEPDYVASLTPSAVERLAKGGLRNQIIAGGQAVRGSFRHERTLAETLTKGPDAFVAAHTNVALEAANGQLIDFLQNHVATENPQVANAAAQIPKGWSVWDPRYGLSGNTAGLSDVELQSAREVAGGGSVPRYIVPDSVAHILKQSTKNYDHYVLKGARTVMSPYRTLALTLSPKFLLHTALSNMVLATAQGVKLSDWAAAWKTYRESVSPGVGPVTRGLRGLTDATLGKIPSAVSDEQLLKAAEALHSDTLTRAVEDARSAADEGERSRIMRGITAAKGSIDRAHQVVQDLSRTAVYHKVLAMGEDGDAALNAVHEAFVDYGALSPAEQGLTRSLLPFYAFQKEMLQKIARYPIDHPVKAAIVMQLGKMHDDMMAGLPEKTRRDYADIPGLGLTSIRLANPFASGADVASIQGLANASNPFVEALARKALGAPGTAYPSQYRVDEYGSLVPDTNLASDLFNVGRSLPQTNAVFGSNSAGGGGFGLTTSVLPTVGINMLPQAREQALRQRVARVGNETAGGGPAGLASAYAQAGVPAPAHQPTQAQLSAATKSRAKLNAKMLGIPAPQSAVQATLNKARGAYNNPF